MTVDLTDVPEALRPAAAAALHAAGVDEGHLSVELVGRRRIRDLNREHRGLDEPTDVLAFPIDGAERVMGPRELGDVTICADLTDDVIEATVHGVLHLCGYDHDVDGGEMMDLQAAAISTLQPPQEGESLR